MTNLPDYEAQKDENTFFLSNEFQFLKMITNFCSRFYVPRRKTEIDDIVDYMGDDPNAGLSDKEKVDEIMYRCGHY